MCWPLTCGLNATDSAVAGVGGSIKLLETKDKF
jgi:hypothetical protein